MDEQVAPQALSSDAARKYRRLQAAN